MPENIPFDADGDDDGDQGDTGTPGSDPNKNFQDLRAAYNRERKQRKEAETRATEAEAFRAQVLAERADQAVTAVFTEAGLANPKLAATYRRLNPDVEPDKVTKEAVLAFAAELGLTAAAPAAGESKDEAKDDGAEGFTPTVAGNAGGKPTVTNKVTPAELAKMLITDPAGADKIVREGRLDNSKEAERPSDRAGSIEFILPE